MEHTLFHYNAEVVSVYDGDTCRVNIDLGLGIWVHNESIRLHRINAPEVRGQEREQGLKSRDYLRDLIEGKAIVLQTIQDSKGKYGRYLGEIWLEMDGEYKCVNDLLVEHDFAEYKDY
ncbi:thermonuclease family protein [candidate division KSB1 bacterium]|nr:thermonuclease family protein [candidate division KSB1 bacterium]